MKSLWQVFAVPLGLALLSVLGLVSALIGDGGWDAVSWLALGIPVAVTMWFGGLRPRQRRRSE